MFVKDTERFYDVVLNKARITRVYDLAADEGVTHLYIPSYAQARAVEENTTGPAPATYRWEVTGDAAWQTVPDAPADEADRYTFGTGLLLSSVPLLHDDEHRTDASKALQRHSTCWMMQRPN